MLIRSDSSVLLVVDMQERLAPAIADGQRLLRNAEILLTAAERLGIPRLASEQYPKGLGQSVPEIKGRLEEQARIPKIHFSCLAEPGFAEHLAGLGRKQVVAIGMEAHVCVLQTVLDLLAAGYETFVVADATGSRAPDNAAWAFDRMASGGAEIVSTEMVVFEWMKRADIPAFKELSALIK